MAIELWNSVYIPQPGALSTVRIQFNDRIDGHARQLLGDCERALQLLRSHVLRAELRVLYSLLHVCNNSLRQHKPFRAIKQVERCINRVKEMKLIPALLDLVDMCPSQAQRATKFGLYTKYLERFAHFYSRQVAAETGQCEVPSQSTLEWFCLKVLGAGKLMASLVDHCSRAFLLTHRYLSCNESIVLNLVLVSMLSRLWVFFGGILKILAPLYLGAWELLQEVAQARPMAFLTDFTLPVDLPTFVGLSCWTQLLAELPAASTVVKNVVRKGNKRSVLKRPIERTFTEDLGSSVLQRPSTAMGHIPVIDLKAMLKRSIGKNSKVIAHKAKMPEKDPTLIGQKMRFLKVTAAASSFSDMAVHLAEVICWCQSRKLRRERCLLAFLNLKCQRMKQLEEEGFRLDRKLKTFKRQFGEAVLLRRSSSARPLRSLRDRWRSWRFRTRFKCVRRGMRLQKRARWDYVKMVMRETTMPAETSVQDKDKDNNIDGKDKDIETSACPWSDSGNEIDDIFATLDF